MMIDQNEKTRQRWGNGLWQALASELPKEQCSTLASKFDQLTEDCGMSPSGAAGIILAGYASDAKHLHRTISGWVETELETLNLNHKGIDKNPATRLKKVIQTINANLDKCGIIINGVPLSQSEIEKVKVRIPQALQSPTLFTATASANEKPRLFLEVTF